MNWCECVESRKGTNAKRERMKLNNYTKIGGLHISNLLYDFTNNEAIPGTGLNQNEFWDGFEKLVEEFTYENAELVAFRKTLQQSIDKWHQENKEADLKEYTSFLQEIGYLEAEPAHFEITPENVDDEVATMSGPQLVVPVDNARFALNAANARWGSLYDALYGTNIIEEEMEKTLGYNVIRGKKVIRYGKGFLDNSAALKQSTHEEVGEYRIEGGELKVVLRNGETTGLREEKKLAGYKGEPSNPSAILLRNNNLHFEIQIDREHPVGKTDPAGVKDILIESALTTIMDCEDSVAAVDVEDKVLIYRNWLGLMKGELEASFVKDNKLVTRKLNPDRLYLSPYGKTFSLKGRSLLFVRNVGHLMKSEAVLDQHGQEVPEGLLDAVFTSLAAMHSLIDDNNLKNSSKKSIYIVKPKMHGPKEVAFSNKLFNRVEDLLGMARHTLKIGLMDEERRTSLNLRACISEVKKRVVFINTGFLDRTGDEIHTSMEAGPMILKGHMKSAEWLTAYEKSNVLTGLVSGFEGRAQIGKGMWAMPDLMAQMMKEKIRQLQAGANTAWVPSPTAATLHALHYHQVDVDGVQRELSRETGSLKDKLLSIPVVEIPQYSEQEIQQEIENNIQGILGYVVRWINQGIGCSKVPDITNKGLMEDRATLRISSQHLANWLYHGICSQEQLEESLKKMAKVVDLQNNEDPNYIPMDDNLNDSLAFQTARDLIFNGREQPNGYTEPILHSRRKQAKSKVTSI